MTLQGTYPPKLQATVISAYALTSVATDFALCSVPVSGRLARIAWAHSIAQATAIATWTIFRNAVSTGVTFTTPTGAAGTGGVEILLPTVDGLDFTAGDMIELRASGSATAGEKRFRLELEQRGDIGFCGGYAYMAAIGTAATAYTVAPAPGKLRSLAFACYTAYTTGGATITIERDGVSTGVTFTVAAVTLKNGHLQEFSPAEMDLLDFAEGEVIGIDTDGIGAAGEAYITPAFKAAPGRPLHDNHFIAYISAVGNVATAFTPMTRRCRVDRVNGVYTTGHTGAIAELDTEKNGTTLGLTAISAAVASAGDSFGGEIILVDEGTTDDFNLFEPGDVLSLVSDGGGAAGEAYMQVSMRDV